MIWIFDIDGVIESVVFVVIDTKKYVDEVNFKVDGARR